MARTTSGPAIVDRLEGCPLAKARLRAILETLCGRASIGAASRTLGISEPRFHAMRREALEATLQSLELKKPGRKKQGPPSPSEERVEALEKQLVELRLKLLVSETRLGVTAMSQRAQLDPEPCAKKGGLQDPTRLRA